MANKLGNCALLEKNFNISKSDKPLKSFLSQIHEVRERKIRIDAWCAALAIPQPLLDPDVSGVDDISDAIENRDTEMKADLTDFIRGLKVRVDVETPLPRTLNVEGTGAGTQESSQVATDDGAQSPEGSDQHMIEDVETDDEPGDSPVGSVAAPPAGADLSGLAVTYKEDESVRLIVDHFASRERNQNETHIDRISRLLDRHGATLTRSAIIRAFRRLDVLGGRFIPGRKGHSTRFEWYAKSRSIRSLAQETSTPEDSDIGHNP